MAKKKASSKKSNVKKVVKKPVLKTKKTSKTMAKKTTAASKKIVKKAAPKKAVAKKMTVKAKGDKKTAIKTTAVKNSKKVAAKQSVPQLAKMKTASAPKQNKVDLSGFISPLDDRLLIRTASAERMTAGGLYIPDTVSDTSGNLEGFVVAVGRGHMNKKGHIRPMDVKVGDRVVFSEYAGSKIKIQNEDLIILREADVMGIVSK
ncbi:MAG: co-chaperone GroES [Pseudobdellovibrionaceae bacterium]